MAKQDNQMQMPGAFGGLMRYNEEYNSMFKFKPTTVIVFIVILAIAIIALKMLFPITPTVQTGTTIPIPSNGLIWSLLI
tara:strand:- start:82 stop:318 length:237 start_codon:yes stop_codon:yes gene_type:complete